MCVDVLTDHLWYAVVAQADGVAGAIAFLEFVGFQRSATHLVLNMDVKVLRMHCALELDSPSFQLGRAKSAYSTNRWAVTGRRHDSSLFHDREIPVSKTCIRSLRNLFLFFDS